MTFYTTRTEQFRIWKVLPQLTLASERETNASGHKVSIDHAVVLRPTLSTETRRIRLLLIEKSNKLRIFKNVNKYQENVEKQDKNVLLATLSSTQQKVFYFVKRKWIIENNVIAFKWNKLLTSATDSMTSHYRQLVRKLLIDDEDDDAHP